MDLCNPNQTYSFHENSSMSPMRPDIEMGMNRVPASPNCSAELGTRHSDSVIQRRPRPVGQFQNAAVKPIMPFLNNLYLRALRMQHLARNLHVFHMQNIYLARQALHLVIRLNDAVDVDEGPSDEQYDERNDLEDELIEVFETMTEWRCDKGDGFQYEQSIHKIKELYSLLFKDRFYFHDVRDSLTDVPYQKAAAYDEKTIRYRQHQRAHVRSSTTVDINCGAEIPAHNPSKCTPKPVFSPRSERHCDYATRREEYSSEEPDYDELAARLLRDIKDLRRRVEWKAEVCSSKNASRPLEKLTKRLTRTTQYLEEDDELSPRKDDPGLEPGFSDRLKRFSSPSSPWYGSHPNDMTDIGSGALLGIDSFMSKPKVGHLSFDPEATEPPRRKPLGRLKDSSVKKDNTESTQISSGGPDDVASQQLREALEARNQLPSEEAYHSYGVAKEISVWDVYTNESRKMDDELLKDWRESLNSLLIFVAIFAAILTAFIIEAKKMLPPNPSEILVGIHRWVPPYVPDPYQASWTAVFINYHLLLASLSLNLFVGLASWASIQWVAHAIARGRSSPQDRARRRHSRFMGDWNMGKTIVVLSLLHHTSVALFWSAVIQWTWSIDHTAGYIVAGGTAIAALFYVIATVASQLSEALEARNQLPSEEAYHSYGVVKEISVWDVYNNESRRIDNELLKDWRESLNLLLIFAAILATILTSFIIEAKKMLSPDPSEHLVSINRWGLNNHGNVTNLSYMLDPFQASWTAISINSHLLASLGLSLVVAQGTLASLHRVAYAITRGRLSPQDRDRRSQFHFVGGWDIPKVITALPLLLYASIALFWSAVIQWTWSIDHTAGYVLTGGTAIAALFYIIATFLGTAVATTLRTQLSRGLYWLFSLLTFFVSRPPSRYGAGPSREAREDFVLADGMVAYSAVAASSAPRHNPL